MTWLVILMVGWSGLMVLVGVWVGETIAHKKYLQSLTEFDKKAQSRFNLLRIESDARFAELMKLSQLLNTRSRS
jgi:hypothetical protein